MKRTIKKETNQEKIARYMLLSKKDLVIMLIQTQYALNVVTGVAKPKK
ncbi:MAG: hypothetical protein KW793_03900 [Candidatus Doudnabacteria bacterium]|nr:hypothetical protein [Candidatus Doudnabacteria bacterium]